MLRASRLRQAQVLGAEPFELEAARDELEVLTDDLLARGDERGELIGLALRQPEDAHARGELQRRVQHASRQRWIDNVVREGAGWRLPSVRKWQLGHVVDLELTEPIASEGDLRPLVCDPAFALLSTLRVTLHPRQRERWIAALEAWEPVLTRLELRVGAEADSPRLSVAACQRLWGALPELQELRVAGGAHLSRIEHPRLRRLVLEEQQTELELGSLPQLRSLGLPLAVEGPGRAWSCELFEAECVAQLRELRVSRVDAMPSVLEAFEPLLRSPVLERIERLRLPSLTFEQLDTLAPSLPQLEFEGSVAVKPPLSEQSSKTRVLLWPHLVEGRKSIWLQLGQLLEALSRHWEVLGGAEQRVGLELLSCYAREPFGEQMPSEPYTRLFAALARVEPEFEKHYRCFELHRDCCESFVFWNER